MTNMKSIFKLSIVAAVSLAMHSCNNPPSNKLVAANKNREHIIAQTFKTDDGWGYTVFVNGKVFIKQSFIPVIEGNKSFPKEEDAIKLATLVVSKLKDHEKPTIRMDELQQLGIVEK